jgi:hypothetical protein
MTPPAAITSDARHAVIRETGPQLTSPSEAVFDSSRAYRYLLTRTWDESAPPVTFIMLNPSTASAADDDATIRRCLAFARREGAGGIEVANLFALRATDPRELRRHPDPVGPLCDEYIIGACPPGRTVIAAWGAHASLISRAATVMRLLADAGVRLHCLGTTRQGHPRHPLYVPASAPLELYAAPTPPPPLTVAAVDPDAMEALGQALDALMSEDEAAGDA